MPRKTGYELCLEMSLKDRTEIKETIGKHRRNNFQRIARKYRFTQSELTRARRYIINHGINS